MKITVTLTNVKIPEQIQIQVDQGQRISTTLRVLSENLPGKEPMKEISEVRERESGRRISVRKTYEEAGIYTGMDLILENTGDDYGTDNQRS